MRPALVMLVVLSVLGSAHAQSHSPAIRSIALPLDVHATVARTGEHACSQSYASSRSTGTLRLTVDRTGATRLVLDGTYAQHSGPSPGRYFQGERGSSDTQQRHHTEWVGLATVVGRGLTIAFDHVDEAELYFAGETPPPLPATTRRSLAIGLRCTIASSDVLPAIESAGERPTATPLLACEWTSAEPSPAMLYVSGIMTFGVGPGVQITSTETMWSYGPTQQIRFVP